MKLFKVALLLLSLTGISFGQNGANDATFNISDHGNGFGDEANNTVFASCLQTDGKILIGGAFTKVNDEIKNRITRLNEDGSTDNTFNVGLGINSNVRAICLQSDGKILVGGDFTSVNGYSKSRIVRLNQDGSVDLSFDSSAQSNGSIIAIGIDSNDKIILGGNFTIFAGQPKNRIVRLNSDGTLDGTFDIGTGADVWVRTLIIQPDGKIFVGGDFSTFNGINVGKLIRLNADGSQDTNFENSSGANASIRTSCLQSDGKIIIGGEFTAFDANPRNRIARLNSDGTIDLSFVPPLGTDNMVNVCKIQSDGKVICGGAFIIVNGADIQYVMRLNLDGSSDISFWQNQGSSALEINTLEILTSGNLFFAGTFGYVNESHNGNYLIVESNGALDGTFNPGTGANDVIFTLDVQSDSKIIVGGNFSSMNGLLVGGNKFARLNSDGSLDSTFLPILPSPFSWIKSVFVQSDDKVLLGGGNNGGGSFIRLDPNGGIDVTFDSEIDNSIVETANVQSDGRILVGGNNIGVNGYATDIARLNSDGSLDPQFIAPQVATSFGANYANVIYSIEIQSDGKILIGGHFNEVDGTIINNPVIRLNPNGSIDGTFTIGSGYNGMVRAIRVLPNGKILVGGNFTTVNGTAKNRLVRLNNDGSLDGAFNIGSGFNGMITDLEIDPDGKIFVVGGFTLFNGSQINRILRLNSDGTLDGTFFPGSGANEVIYACSKQGNDKIILGGGFTNYNGSGRNRIARVGSYPSNQGGVNVFTVPSELDSCNGTAYFSVTGIPDFTFDIGNGSPVISSGYAVFDSICPGIYSVVVTDGNGDTLSSTFVVPSDSTYILVDPFDTNDIIADTVTIVIENCDLDYPSIDTVYIDSYSVFSGNSVLINWAVVDVNGITIIPTLLEIPLGNNYLQLELYCPNKSLSKYFVVTIGVNYDGNRISTLGINKKGVDLFEIYPNPTNDQVHINFSGSDAELTVYDVQGKVVLKDQIQNSGIVSLQNFERGVYLFDFKNSQGHSVQRVVKQ
ncbi:T9SS type A sorting domain-containing protein [Fluviicola taffensis]|uniref:T9SS type A sorting domain-containing protein n=1 Tax=Fluviicola taffensis TaxID=191579 RepID=UPI003137B98A